MSLRILYHHRIRADDGQAVHVRELIDAFVRRGHEVRECALVPKSGPVRDGGSSHGGFWKRLRLPRIAVEAMEIAYNRKAASMLDAAASGWRPHVVYERHALHCRAGLDAARRLGVPLLLEVNSPMTDEMQRLGLLRFGKKARATERETLRGADRVLAVTQTLADRLVELGAQRDRVVVIGNGAQPERYGPAARDDARSVRTRWRLPEDAVAMGFVGFMRDWHRLDMAVACLSRPGFEKARLVLVGDGPALPSLLQQARALGVQDRLVVVGKVSADAVPSHVCAFDVALIPAINAYASPLKLFDSMAAGVATIAPDQHNLREIVEEGVHASLFRADDADAFASKLVALVADRALRQRIGAAAAARLAERKLTWDGNAERIEQIVRALVPGGAT